MAGGAAVLKRLLVSGRSLHWLKLSIKKRRREAPPPRPPPDACPVTNGYDEKLKVEGELLVLERANKEWGEKERVWRECGNGSGRRVEGGVRDSLSHGGDTVHRRFGAKKT